LKSGRNIEMYGRMSDEVEVDTNCLGGADNERSRPSIKQYITMIPQEAWSWQELALDFNRMFAVQHVPTLLCARVVFYRSLSTYIGDAYAKAMPARLIGRLADLEIDTGVDKQRIFETWN
jgi:hypothetical protein